MRNTPILIPIILVICLGTLAYLLYAALSTTVPAGAVSSANTIALNDLRVTPPPARANISNAPAADADIDRYFEDVPESQLISPTEDEPMMEPDEDVELHGMDNDVTRQVLEDRNGAYVVLAGSFRQLLNAEGQVKKLKKAGFAESKVMKSTGGAYAMAIVGRRASRADAEELMRTVQRKGFDVRVVKQ